MGPLDLMTGSLSSMRAGQRLIGSSCLAPGSNRSITNIPWPIITLQDVEAFTTTSTFNVRQQPESCVKDFQTRQALARLRQIPKSWSAPSVCACGMNCELLSGFTNKPTMAMEFWNRWRSNGGSIRARHTDAIQLILSDLVPLICNTLKVEPSDKSLFVPLENAFPRFGPSGMQPFEKCLKTTISKRKPVVDDGVFTKPGNIGLDERQERAIRASCVFQKPMKERRSTADQASDVSKSCITHVNIVRYSMTAGKSVFVTGVSNVRDPSGATSGNGIVRSLELGEGRLAKVGIRP